MRAWFIVVIAISAVGFCQASELNRDQRLVVACYHLDVDGVVTALREGANANGRFGEGDAKLFTDPWSLGWIGYAKMLTPFLALASASNYPDPPSKIQNTLKDLDWAREQKAKIPIEQLEQRRRLTLTIAFILLSHHADIDADDGYGATALFEAVSSRKLELAKLLLRFNAKVNTKTGVYIDGPGDITPLHEASWSAELTKLLLEKGADPKAKDSEGKTPADWARMSNDPSVAHLYESP